MFSSDTQNNLSNSFKKNKKSTNKNSSITAVRDRSENSLLKRPLFRSGRVQEESQKFLSIPDDESMITKREDRSIPSTNPSSSSNLSFKSKKGKLKKSSFSHHSSKSKTKSKTIENDDQSFNKNKSMFEPSKLLKQPVQPKKYNLDFDSRWEYFLELKTLDDATRRIYNSAFFQIWKTLYQKRYMKKAEMRASQIESTLDRFNSTHTYNHLNSFSNSYNILSGKYNAEQSFKREVPTNYSFNSYQNSSEARVEKMQQKYRKQFNNYNNYDPDNNIRHNRSYDIKYNGDFETNYDQNNSYNSRHNNTNNDNYNDGSFESSYREYQNMFKNNDYNKANIINNYNSNLNKNEYTNNNYYEKRKLSNAEYSNESYNIKKGQNRNYDLNNKNQIFNKSYNLENYNKNNTTNLSNDENLDFDYLRSKSLSLKTSASDSINKAVIANSNEFNTKNEEFIRQSRSYDPSISRELIDEIEGRISDQYDKEVALDFASQLNTIAKFNNTLNGYNQPRKNLIIEENDEFKDQLSVSHTQSNEFQNKNDELQNESDENDSQKEEPSKQNENYNNQTNDNNEEEEEFNDETNLNELNNSTDFIENTERKAQKESNNNYQKQSIDVLEKSASQANTSKRNNLNENQVIQNDLEIINKLNSQQKKIADKYDKYINQITNPSKPNNDLFFDDDDDDDDLEDFIQIQKMKYNSTLNYGKTRNNQSNQQNFIIKNNNNYQNNFSLEKLLQEEETKNNEIPVDTDLGANIARKASASRIRSVLSKSTIGFNSKEADSDLDQIDLSGVQFYHISQAEKAKFTNSNLPENAKNDKSNEKVRKLRIMNEPEINESDDLTPVPRNQSKRDDKSSSNRKEQFQENSRKLNASGSLDQSSPKNGLNVSLSTRRKRSATLSGISPIARKNLQNNEQLIDNADQRKSRQQASANEQNNRKKQETENDDAKQKDAYDQNSRRGKQTTEYDQSRQANGYDQRNLRNQANGHDQRNQTTEYDQSRQTSGYNQRNQRNQANEFDQSRQTSGYNQRNQRNQANEYGQNSQSQKTSEFDQSNIRKQSQRGSEYDQNSRDQHDDDHAITNKIKQSQQPADYDQNQQSDDYDQSSSRSKQSDEYDQIKQRKRIQKTNEYESISQMQESSEYDQNNRMQQTRDSDQRKQRKQTSNEYNQQNKSEAIQNNRKFVTNEIFESNIKQQSNKTYKNSRSQISIDSSNNNNNKNNKSINNSIRKQQSTQVESSKLDISSPISLSLKKSKSNTTSEYTEVSKRSILSRDDASDESEGNDFTRQVRKKQRRSINQSFFDDREYSDDADYYYDGKTRNKHNRYSRIDNLKRSRLASMFDANELHKMEKKAHLCDILSRPFPDDLYDDVFTTGSYRRNEYLENTKLASIINFFTMKENETG